MLTQIFNINNYSLNIHGILVGIISLLILFTGLSVVIKNKFSFKGITFFLVSLSINLWLTGMSFLSLTKNVDITLFWAKFTEIGVVFLPSNIYLYTATFSKITEREKTNIHLNYFASSIFVIIILLTDKFVSGVYKYNWGYYPVLGPLSYPFLLMFSLVLIGALDKYVNIVEKVKPRLSKTQIIITYFSILFVYFALIDFLPSYRIEVYPAGYILLSIFYIWFTWINLKYRIMTVPYSFAVEQMITAITDLLFIIDTENKISISNSALCDILGYEEDELIGKPVETIFADKTLIKKFYNGTISEKDILRNIETELIKKDGNEIPVLFSQSIMYNQDNEPEGIICVAKDIIELKKVETELRTVNRLLKTISACNQIMNRTETEQELLNNICEIMVKEYGYRFVCICYIEPDETSSIRTVAQSGIIDMVPDSINSVNREYCHKVIQTHEPLIIKDIGTVPEWASLREHSIKYGYKSVILLPLISDNKCFGIMNLYSTEPYISTEKEVELLQELVNDISYRIFVLRAKTEEENLKKEKEKLQLQMFQMEKISALGQLSSGIAHELNNPLTTILGLTQYQLKKTDKSSDLYNDLKTIESLSLRSRDIIRTLLAYSRQTEMKFELLDINQIIEKSIELVGHQIELNNIKVIKMYTEKLPYISGVNQLLIQVFVNLISNACDAMTDGGTLTISTERADNKIKLTDTGKGIPKEIMDKIFRPFFTTKPVGKGTGLGLPIVKNIIEKHKGEISVKSPVDDHIQGTVFTILLPAV